MDNLMIKVDNVSKEYVLGMIGGTTLREELQRKHAKIHHLEDPTLKIGQVQENKSGIFLALDGISFEVKKGEAVGIIGHNGAGKSTLLKLITRITAPTSGKIYLNGRVASMLEVGTGFHAELTGRENIYVNGAILGMTKKEIDSKIDNIIDFSECRQFIDTPVKRYSSGMYVKLAFSVAAHLDSEIVIMDEVLAVGDVAFQNKCIQKMKEIASSGRTVLYVSHNMGTIRSLCDRCIVLNHGKLIFDGNVENAISKYITTNFSYDTYIDLSSKKRAYQTSNLIHFLYFKTINKERNLFIMGESIEFQLAWDARKEMSSAQIRLNLFTVEMQGIAITFSDKFKSFAGKNQRNFNFDASSIMPGKYKLEIIFLELSENGSAVKHDIIGRNELMFEIIPSDEKKEYRSAVKSWGYFELPTVRIEN